MDVFIKQLEKTQLFQAHTEDLQTSETPYTSKQLMDQIQHIRNKVT